MDRKVNIVVGVCGGIAAYKTVEVVSRLKKTGYNVHVIMTRNAQEFITPLTFQTISSNKVDTDMFERPDVWDVHHISLAQKADLVLVAPATANIIGKIATGIADDLLSTVIMATKSKVVFVPAMNTAMFENSIVQENISRLQKAGYCFIEPDIGLMACGTAGKGRFPEPKDIVEYIKSVLISNNKDFDGKRVLISAGPTREMIDPVRFLSNRSSGKMGYAIAQAAYYRGADVRLVTGPVADHISKQISSDINVINVTTATEMNTVMLSEYHNCDIVIMAAAVADYMPKCFSNMKIKKNEEELSFKLVRTPDIAKNLGEIKSYNKLHIGFAAETENLIENSLNKIGKKKLDFIVANDITQKGAGFEVDTNIIKIIKPNKEIIEYPILSKKEAANAILDEVSKLIK